MLSSLKINEGNKSNFLKYTLSNVYDNPLQERIIFNQINFNYG